MGKFLFHGAFARCATMTAPATIELGINFIQPFGLARSLGDSASFRRFERRSAPGDGPLGGIQHSGMTVS